MSDDVDNYDNNDDNSNEKSRSDQQLKAQILDTLTWGAAVGTSAVARNVKISFSKAERLLTEMETAGDVKRNNARRWLKQVVR